MSEVNILPVLTQVAEEAIGYYHLQLISQQRGECEALNFREIITHLRSIFDEANARERKHIERLTHFPKLLKTLDQRYYKMKDRAKALIKECQEDKVYHSNLYEQVLATYQQTETELQEVQAVLKSQTLELTTLEEVSKNIRSTNEIANLLDQVDQLIRQNEELNVENAILERKIFEMQEHLNKLASENGTNVDTARIDQDTVDMKACISLQQRLRETAKTVDELKSQFMRQRTEYDQIITKEQREADKLKQDAERLLTFVDNLRGSKNDNQTNQI